MAVARHIRTGVAAAALLTAAVAAAGPLVVAPTTVTIEPGRRAAVVEVTNPGDEPVDLQFRAYDWQQENGEDRLTASEGLVISPAIATVPPHGKQLFRVLQTGAAAAPGERERSYRLRLNQLPRADQPAVAVYLEFLLPVFQGAAAPSPQLIWARRPGAVTITNTGQRRVRLRELALAGPGGASTPLPGAASAYLLSGASRTFAVPPGAAGERLVGAADTGPIDAPPTALAAR